MNAWQAQNRKRLLSLSIEPDGGTFTCIALTNPTEVVICDGGSDDYKVWVSGGKLEVRT